MTGTTNRREMIGKLVEHSVSTAVSEFPQHWLKEVFEKGFVGYSKFSDRQLMLEMQLRGLTPTEDLADEVDSDDDSIPEHFFG